MVVVVHSNHRGWHVHLVEWLDFWHYQCRVRPKWGRVNMAHLCQLTEFCSNNHVPTIYFWFCVDNINHCVKDSTKKWVLDGPNLLIVWQVKVGTKITWEEVFSLEDVGFQLQQREALSPHCRLDTMPKPLIPHSHFRVSANPNAHPNK